MNKNYRKKSQSLRSSFGKLERDTPLGEMIYNTTEEWYKAKHPKFNIDEVNLVNSICISECPYCHAAGIIKNGKRRDGIQTYQCLRCLRRFNPMTGTLFDSRKIPITEWVEFLIHLFQYESMTVSSLDNRNVPSTGQYWTEKLFEVLKHYQDDIMLGGVFWIDETYLSKMPSELSLDEENRKMRGLSRDKYCIVTATDGDNCVLFASGLGKPSSARISKVMKNHIACHSTMIDDEEKSHQILVDEYHLERISYSSQETSGMDDDANPMNMINTLHKFFKKFMSRHGSYDRDELQSWCNLFCFMYNHKGEVAEMTKDFLKMAISTKKVMRYRDVMAKKP